MLSTAARLPLPALLLVAALALPLAACDDGSSDRRVPPGDQCTSTCDVKGGTECREPGFRTCDDFDGDGCVEWGAVQACARSCVAGQCVDCVHDCVEGSTQCGPGGGVQQCLASVDADLCFEWAAEASCGEGESCSGGTCRPSDACVNECGEAGQRQCSGAGYQVCGTSQADDCLHWGAVVACEGGETCSLGTCRQGCANECEPNSRRCRLDGFETCGNFDEDECTEWSSLVKCEGEQVCSNGACADRCVNECAPRGQRECSGNGVRICQLPEGAECLRWAEATPCDEGQTCSGGQCRAGCVNECGEGSKQCAGNGIQTCGNYDDDDCMEWSEAVACDENETCSGGACSVQCRNECGVLNQRQCAGNGFQVCGNNDEDPCLEWGVAQGCPAGESCSGGVCSARCVNECAEGSTQCSGNGTQTCANFDDDACMEWSAVTPCAEGEGCSAGQCAQVCGDECVRGNTRCAPGGLQRCGDFDEDACSDWGTPSPCPAGQFCSNGACAARCDHECAAGARRCGAGGFQTCGNFDNDDCREWSGATPCPPGEICSSGQCTASCNDECAAGTVQCAGNGFQTCGDSDDDDCLEWGEMVACQDGTACSGGVCTRFCNDECVAGNKRCGAGGVESCGNFDGDNCLEWSAGRACPAGQACSNGLCADVCEDECAQGDTRCAPGGVQECGNYDPDDCSEWSVTRACAMGDVCDNGACVPFAADCNADADCADGFICAVGVCVERRGCIQDADCAAGETCDVIAGTCRPQGDVGVGAPCGGDGDCGGDLLCAEPDLGGYCTTICDADTPCPVGSTCYLADPDDPEFAVCLRDCASAAGCREGRACYPSGGPLGGACYISQCAEDADCPSDALIDMACADGVCTVTNGCDAETGEGCGAEDVCVQYLGIGVCTTLCEVFGPACAAGLRCEPAGVEDLGICIPVGFGGVGADCADNGDCDGETLCIGDGTGAQSCLPQCDTNADPGPCGDGFLCLAVAGTVGACLDDCVSDCNAGDIRCEGGSQVFCEQADADICLEWGDPIPCGAGLGCNAISGECDMECFEDADCAHPLVDAVCIDGSCSVNSECDVETGEGCEEFELCFIASADGSAGSCQEPCDPVDAICNDGQDACVLFGGGAFCRAPGATVEGDYCFDSSECAAGLTCVTLPSGQNQCLTVCDAETGLGCDGGDLCVDLGIDGRVGVCIEPCEDECGEGAAQCGDQGGTQVCDWVLGGGVCLGWADEEACPQGQRCDEQTSECRTFCNEDADCAGEDGVPRSCDQATGFCSLSECAFPDGNECGGDDFCVPEGFDEADEPLAAGFCLHPCDPVIEADACGLNGKCDYWFLAGDYAEFFCLPAGPGLPGDDCFDLLTCSPGTACIPLEGVDAPMCLVYCNLDVDCGEGEACAQVPYFADGTGVCLPR